MARKEFTFHGKTAEEVQKLSLNEFKELIPANLRRSLERGMTYSAKRLLVKLEAGKDKVKTHARELPVLPIMIGKQIGIHNGREFIFVTVTAEMLGHRLGEFTYNRKRIQHSAPGIGATKGTGHVSVK